MNELCVFPCLLSSFVELVAASTPPPPRRHRRDRLLRRQAEEPQVETGRLPRVHARDGLRTARRASRNARDQGRAGAVPKKVVVLPFRLLLLRDRGLSAAGRGRTSTALEPARRHLLSAEPVAGLAAARRLRAGFYHERHRSRPSPRPIRHRRDQVQAGRTRPRRRASRLRTRPRRRASRRSRPPRSNDGTRRPCRARGLGAARRGAAVHVRERRRRRGRGAAGPAPVAAAVDSVGVGPVAFVGPRRIEAGQGARRHDGLSCELADDQAVRVLGGGSGGRSPSFLPAAGDPEKSKGT